MKNVVKYAAGIMAVLFAVSAHAEDPSQWPSHPVKIIVPAEAGGGLDAATRLMADALTKRLGQPFILQNIAGVPMVGTAFAAHAPADGYTVLTATGNPIEILPLLRKDLSYDPERDLIPVGLINESVSVLTINPKMIPANNLQELIKLLKANPNKYDYGSNGIGGEAHLNMEMLELRQGFQVHHIPYRAGAEQLVAIMGGEVGIEFMNSKTVLPHIVDGTLKGMAVVSAKRLPDLPNVPTLGELFPGYGAFSTWQGLLLPHGTPQPIVDKLAAALNDYVASPQAKTEMNKVGASPRLATQAEFAALIKTDTAAWAQVIKAANIKVE